MLSPRLLSQKTLSSCYYGSRTHEAHKCNLVLKKVPDRVLPEESPLLHGAVASPRAFQVSKYHLARRVYQANFVSMNAPLHKFTEEITKNCSEKCFSVSISCLHLRVLFGLTTKAYLQRLSGDRRELCMCTIHQPNLVTALSDFPAL